MGWFREGAPGHEGYVVGYVIREGCDASIVRELAYPEDKDPRADLVWIGAACVCGWRSPYFQDRRSALPSWAPFSVLASEKDEDHAMQLWGAHLVLSASPVDR
jgi:hypothetical protein